MLIENTVVTIIALFVVVGLMGLGALILFPRKAEHDPYAKPHGWEE